ncbi:uncharacterized protein LOC106072517 isoform X2 [Biomphalaria glabrata]|uniref:Uncharacterized protein LOC106072517 isoform X2 n=1 Tax=Biomphalaria glabrata TaxID=6526 RepID=A0A9W2ZPW4_BIOGL|nr:uncharacterized protein LOC106072517 isoform X2 [Biomphalaria glabrata]
MDRIYKEHQNEILSKRNDREEWRKKVDGSCVVPQRSTNQRIDALNAWPKPNPENCRTNPGYQLYRNKNVQMCLKFYVFNSPVPYRQGMDRCDDQSAIVGVFNTMEKLEILQRQTRCVWVNFRIGALYSTVLVWAPIDFEEIYTYDKHGKLFRKDYEWDSTAYKIWKRWVYYPGNICGIYHPKYKRLVVDDCQAPDKFLQDCGYNVVCELMQFTREDL